MLYVTSLSSLIFPCFPSFFKSASSASFPLPSSIVFVNVYFHFHVPIIFCLIVSWFTSELAEPLLSTTNANSITVSLKAVLVSSMSRISSALSI